jgi:DNA modification methylase
LQVNTIDQTITDEYALYQGDCVEVTRGIPDSSIHYSIFSPPFASLYTYSNSERDMGNCQDDTEFITHFKFLVKELYRVTIPGRLISFHCMNLPTSKAHHGYIGIRDFRGELIRAFEAEGWIYHSEVCIWKDPVVAQQRTKALGLLHKQLVKDSCMSRQGIPDYLVTMRKPGVNPEPVSGCFKVYYGNWEEPDREKYTTDYDNRNWYSIEVWQRYASPVWMDIRPSDTLQFRSAREEKDEKHICPLQLDVIARGVELWSNPGDIVFDPFAGIGSTGYQAVKMGRRFVGVELKESYYKTAIRNLDMAIRETIDDMLS